jgi:hypothetical protein
VARQVVDLENGKPTKTLWKVLARGCGRRQQECSSTTSPGSSKSSSKSSSGNSRAIGGSSDGSSSTGSPTVSGHGDDVISGSSSKPSPWWAESVGGPWTRLELKPVGAPMP